MNGPSPAQMEMARRLLAHEGAEEGQHHCAVAAGRVYDKLHANLDPLLGAAGVQLLFVRSAKLAHGGFSFVEVSTVEASTKLRECLERQDPAVATAGAQTLFGIFLTLITTFIGPRLVTEALRSAWPTIE